MTKPGLAVTSNARLSPDATSVLKGEATAAPLCFTLPPAFQETWTSNFVGTTGADALNVTESVWAAVTLLSAYL